MSSRTKLMTLLFFIIIQPILSFSSWTEWTQVGPSLPGRQSAINYDGSIIAIASWTNNSVHIFQFMPSNSSWIQLGSAIHGLSDETMLNREGNIVAVRGTDGNCSVRVFSWNGTDWSQMGSCFYETDLSVSFRSISLNEAGNRIAIGVLSICVRVYQWDETTWIQVGADIVEGATLGYSGHGDQTGSSVALNGDGTIVVVGAPNSGSVSSYKSRGQVRVFQWDGGSWNSIGSYIEGDAKYDNAGEIVDINQEGNIIAITIRDHDESGRRRRRLGSLTGGDSCDEDFYDDIGAVRAYQYIGADWTQFGEFEGQEENDKLGSSLVLNGDGTIVAIGDYNGVVQFHKYESICQTWVSLGQNIVEQSSHIALDGSGYNVVIGDGELLQMFSLLSTLVPTAETIAPTAPSSAPTDSISQSTTSPMPEPTTKPTGVTLSPTSPTDSPTAATSAPTAAIDAPTAATNSPTAATGATTSSPTTSAPTGRPTVYPTASPTNDPIWYPTEEPTTPNPTLSTAVPTHPTAEPALPPSNRAMSMPTATPTIAPTFAPRVFA